MLAILILVGVIAVIGIIYGLARYQAVLAGKKQEKDGERRQKQSEEKKKQERLHTERQMHQEEALTMAKNNPDLVARVVKNWLT